ncbi:hypothetical protein BKA93DRAFT_588354 [Sparassis latifolia]
MRLGIFSQHEQAKAGGQNYIFDSQARRIRKTDNLLQGRAWNDIFSGYLYTMAAPSDIPNIDDFPDITSFDLPNDTFFAWDDPHDDVALNAYLDKRHRDGEASREYLLGDKPYPVEVVARWYAFNFPWSDTPPPADRRPVPAAVLDSAFTNPHSIITIMLTHPIKTGIPASSQVWQGTIHASPTSRLVTSSTEIPGAPTVLKLFVESALGPPWQFDPDRGLEQGFWPFSGKQARAEARAYACMRSLQGKEVPWSYGFYCLRLPYGELAYAHAMELVPGEPMRSVCLRDAPPALVWPLADAMAVCLHSLTLCGVLQGDVDKRNMILAPPDAAQRVVFVDFNLAGPVRVCSTDRGVEIVMLINDIGGCVTALAARLHLLIWRTGSCAPSVRWRFPSR